MKADPSKPLVELREIKKAFGGVQAVDGVSVNLYPGEVVALLGHNGAGKSTLMKMLAGAYPIDSGDTIIAGEKAHIRTPADARRKASRRSTRRWRWPTTSIPWPTCFSAARR